MKTLVIKSFITKGIEAIPVKVSVSITDGNGIHLVGVQDIAVNEILLRSTTALMSLGYRFPSRKIVIDIKAADGKMVTCHASNLDLPVAVGILAASGQWKESIEHLNDYAIVGELGLNGSVRPVASELTMALASGRIILPSANAAYLAHKPGVEDRGKVYAASNLNDVRVIVASPEEHDALDIVSNRKGKAIQEDEADTAFIDGATNVRRALLIAAAGGHSINLVGYEGKYLSRCLHSILPRMTEGQYIETEKVYEVKGQHLPDTVTPPLREPTCISTLATMVGGGASVEPGEVSLASNGLLILRNLADWPKSILETVHRVREDGYIRISRLNGAVLFPADFMLMGATHPDEKFKEKAEGLFDISYDIGDFTISKTPVGTSSEALRERVEKARAIQAKRYAGEAFETNSCLKGEALDRYCGLSTAAKEFIKKIPAPPEFNNAGNVNRLMRVARTIADLEEEKNVEFAHILEAINFLP